MSSRQTLCGLSYVCLKTVWKLLRTLFGGSLEVAVTPLEQVQARRPKRASISISRDCFVEALTDELLLGNVECILAGFWVFAAETAGVARGTTFAFAMGRGAMCLSPPSCLRTAPGCGVLPRRPDIPVGTSPDLTSGFGAFGACAIACDGLAVAEAAGRAGSALRDEADVLPNALPVFRAPAFAGTTPGPSAGTRRFKRGFFRALAGYALNSSSEGMSNMSGLVVAAREGPL
jgi:hypothetical protein